MERIKTTRGRGWALLGGFAAVAIAVGVGSAAVPAPSGSITACVKTKGGDDGGAKGSLRVVDAASDCKKNEQALSWNQQGPAGPSGAAGPAGAPARQDLPAPPERRATPVRRVQPGAQGLQGPKGADGATEHPDRQRSPGSKEAPVRERTAPPGPSTSSRATRS